MDSEIPLGFTQWKSSDDTDNDRIILNTIGEHAEVKVTNLKLIFDSKKINWFPRLRVVSMKTISRNYHFVNKCIVELTVYFCELTVYF